MDKFSLWKKTMETETKWKLDTDYIAWSVLIQWNSLQYPVLRIAAIKLILIYVVMAIILIIFLWMKFYNLKHNIYAALFNVW